LAFHNFIPSLFHHFLNADLSRDYLSSCSCFLFLIKAGEFSDLDHTEGLLKSPFHRASQHSRERDIKGRLTEKEKEKEREEEREREREGSKMEEELIPNTAADQPRH
jgi:hypothetical protein